MDILNIIGRKCSLFQKDLEKFDPEITELIENNRFLIIGGGGTIGQAVVNALFNRSAKAVHVVDLNENYLVELVREIRSDDGYLVADFDTFALDCGSEAFRDFICLGNYDYVLNLAAMKHVRSENNPFSMMRMFETNVLLPIKTYQWAAEAGAKKYFCVSSDKASNPANFMGATKCAMELSLMREQTKIPITGARFANVAFSNGSLLEGFQNRIAKKQPFSVPTDVVRFFITPEEAGLICIFSAMLGNANEIFFPNNHLEIKLTSFKLVAENYLRVIGKTPVACYDESEARELSKKIDLDRYWPINYFTSDTTGEKPFEEFHTASEDTAQRNFYDLSMIQYKSRKTQHEIDNFFSEMKNVRLASPSARSELLSIMADFVPTFEHIEANKFLNQRM